VSKTIYAMMPINASAKFKAKVPDNWNEMDEEDKIEYFFKYARPVQECLCNSCSSVIDTNMEVDLTALDIEPEIHFTND
jgi:hypothetical protein